MAKYAHSEMLDGGLNALKNNAIKMLLIKAYAAGDPYATVTANAIASVDMVPADFVISGADAQARVVTVAAKSGPASSSSLETDDLHVALTDGIDTVLMVTDELSNQVITSGNPVDFPSFTYTSGQPV